MSTRTLLEPIALTSLGPTGSTVVDWMNWGVAVVVGGSVGLDCGVDPGGAAPARGILLAAFLGRAVGDDFTGRTRT